jgi:hypothetical protein
MEIWLDICFLITLQLSSLNIFITKLQFKILLKFSLNRTAKKQAVFVIRGI